MERAVQGILLWRDKDVTGQPGEAKITQHTEFTQSTATENLEMENLVQTEAAIARKENERHSEKPTNDEPNIEEPNSEEPNPNSEEPNPNNNEPYSVEPNPICDEPNSEEPNPICDEPNNEEPSPNSDKPRENESNEEDLTDGPPPGFPGPPKFTSPSPKRRSRRLGEKYSGIYRSPEERARMVTKPGYTAIPHGRPKKRAAICQAQLEYFKHYGPLSQSQEELILMAVGVKLQGDLLQ
ncbi:hypothetical protein FCM35_KLT16580 [Carex littledalei]|uniref:Uncharacterized protein n=1 Tax=Carex littledalei TaxID=544730 RepID=A0A833RT63_9POAL|nr:hypothetical protein FCM35_KLT16580 [Carex littledalei]